MPYRKGMIRQHGSELGIFHRMVDATVILSVFYGSAIGYGVSFEQQYQLAGMVAVVGFLLFAELHALYSSWRAESIGREAWMILSVWILTLSVLFALAFLSKSSVQFSRVTILVWAVTTPIALIGEHSLLRYVLRKFRILGLNTRSVAIVGNGKAATKLIDVITSSPWMGLKISGTYDGSENVNMESSQFCRDTAALIQDARNGKFDCVYIAYTMQEESKIRLLIEKLADTTVSVHIVPDVFVSELFHARWTSLGEVPLVSVFESPFYGSNSFFKRMEDLLLGSLILLLVSPLLIAIAVAVRLTSPGPALFKQRRYGLNGQVIEVWKFRSMCVQEDGGHVPQAQKNDPRVTKLGAILRKTSLDELPQFINVLQGQMSIVGPRPHAVAHNEQYRTQIHGYMLRHTVKPGITGWAQVNGWRGETDTVEKMEMRVKYDLDYINNWSIAFDIKIIWMTIFGGMRGKNAY
jgi:putative colanic acid biosynthesis UDP-glucose lipid carrier transferase